MTAVTVPADSYLFERRPDLGDLDADAQYIPFVMAFVWARRPE